MTGAAWELGTCPTLARPLFGEIVTSASGQHWIDRFLAKDPEQSSFVTLLSPIG